MELSKAEIAILRHALGADSDNPGYRNRYTVNPERFAIIKPLLDSGLMVAGYKSPTTGLVWYHATRAGCRMAGLTEKQTMRAMEQ